LALAGVDVVYLEFHGVKPGTQLARSRKSFVWRHLARRKCRFKAHNGFTVQAAPCISAAAFERLYTSSGMFFRVGVASMASTSWKPVRFRVGGMSIVRQPDLLCSGLDLLLASARTVWGGVAASRVRWTLRVPVLIDGEVMTESFPSCSYRFVQDRSELFLNDSTGKICLKIVVLMFLVFLGFLLVLGAVFLARGIAIMEQVKTILPSVVMELGNVFLKSPVSLLYLLPLLALHAYLRRLAIVVEEKGVTFQGFLFSNIGKHYEWRDFVRICRVSQSQGEALVFIDRYGRSFLIHFGEPRTRTFGRRFFSWSVSWTKLMKEENQNRPRPLCFVGDGHTLSLPEAIEEFHGQVTPLEEGEKKKIPALHQGFCWNSVIEGRASNLAFAACCLILLALVLVRYLTTQYFLLDTWQSRVCGWTSWLFCGLGFSFVWRCLKKEESREVAWIISLLFAAPLWFLVTPAATLLPAWLGEARQETFIAQDGRGRRQDWRAEKIPGLSFAREIPRQRRAHEPGARREFTVYHGPLGLYAMPFAELKPLWTEEQSLRE
jgi:hypothetical protein